MDMRPSQSNDLRPGSRQAIVRFGEVLTQYMALNVCIACVKTKRGVPCRAGDMYVSPLFRSSLAYARSLHPDRIFILSAKYGLVDPDKTICPYELTLKTMSAKDRAEWARRVLVQLRQRADVEADEFVFLAGEAYRAGLVDHLRHWSAPLRGLPFGAQLQWLKRKLPS